MNNIPFYNQLLNHRSLDRSSFHTPGHKNNYDPLNHLLELDYTELPDTDSLFEASGAILDSELRCAEVLNTKRTLFSAGGCSLCIQAMIRLASLSGKKKIMMHRVVHRSAVQTLALLGLEPVWLYPSIDNRTHWTDRIFPGDVKNLLQKNEGEVCAVYLTSPDYFGYIQNIEEIAAICHSYDVPLIIDNAHGAHLKLTSQKHPLDCGADMTADSAHKTLPVLTGGAWLHINNSKYIDEAKNAMSLFASTSPSYPIMASLDICTDWIDKHGKSEYAALENRISEIKKLASKRGFILPEGLIDPVRISLNTVGLGIDGNQLADYFRANKIEPEHSDSENVILIPTPFNRERDFERLSEAIMNAPSELTCKNITSTESSIKYPIIKMTPREAMLAEFEYVTVDHSAGRIAQDIFCPCPPGVPVVMPGEEINQFSINLLKKYGFSFIKVVK